MPCYSPQTLLRELDMNAAERCGRPSNVIQRVRAGGANQALPRRGSASIQLMEVPIPPEAESRQIVAEFEARTTAMNDIEQILIFSC